ncbi:GntP family permease [Cobetia sp. 14N.309.X.WAT.E.A4]|uniref:GntP family permease n=1 Tax=Cobetia sp. 14N.309.X.WAT.E.A4 TaxID=2998323 RepID=UPI0025B092C7|nr:GntP family permease [Cobetia sp. 14N.309.X.WAT.E.A4]MDN2655988.1 GntP family permease [Cobetia sp. 14N.309.X.WAT.E.A4]
MSILAILISLGLLMFLAYRGITVLLLAPVMAALAVVLSGDAGALLPSYTVTFMSQLGGYLAKFFPLFILGALFGQLMADSGAAHAISEGLVKRLGTRHVILTVVLACALLTYGGVSLFVVAFAVYPIGAQLFRRTSTPKRLLPAALALGSFTFTMTALPGTPAIQNAIPIPYFQTNSFAAPGLGIIAGLIMLGLGTWWLKGRATKAQAQGEGYGKHDNEALNDDAPVARMSMLTAVIPLILVIGLNALLTYLVFPRIDFSYLNDAFPELDPAGATGMWSILIALSCASLWLVVTRWKQWADLKTTVNNGCFGAMLPVFNTASEVGYGAVIASLAGFALVKEAVLGLYPDNPLISEAVAVNVLAGITGSSSGGMSIALSTLGSTYMEMAVNAGIDPELMHRVAALAAGSMDTLPHSGAVITLLAICKLTHRQSYGQMFMMTVAFPMLALISVVTLGSLFGSF